METILNQDPISHEGVETMGGRITRAREAMNISTAQLARRSGLKTETISRWENDLSEPRANKLNMLAGMLNVSPTWLLVGHGSGPDDSYATDEMRVLKRELGRAKEIADNLYSMIESMEQRLERYTHPSFQEE